jgi:hypothetical protein
MTIKTVRWGGVTRTLQNQGRPRRIDRARAKPCGDVRRGQGSLLQSLAYAIDTVAPMSKASNCVVTERRRRRDADALLAQPVNLSVATLARWGDLQPARSRSGGGRKSLARLTQSQEQLGALDHREHLLEEVWEPVLSRGLPANPSPRGEKAPTDHVI